MPTLLVVNSSGRHTRSVTRRLTSQFSQSWLKARSHSRLIERDLGLYPPSPVNERWIASAFAHPEKRTGDMVQALEESEILINEIEDADAIVFGVPMYNFGVPAQLKAYFDQVIRVNRTFAFDAEAQSPYQPLLADKPTTIIISVGDGTILPGGEQENLNFLEPHISTMLEFIGLRSLEFVRVGYEEFQDRRLQRSLEEAEQALEQLVVSGSPGLPA